MTDLGRLLPDLSRLIRTAGAAVMEVYRAGFAVEMKADHSPVTAADRASEDILLAGLTRLTPGIAIASEESAPSLPPDCRTFWLVDPLDGTKEFVKQNGEFSINLGLVVDGVPRLGVLFAPVTDRLFTGVPGQARVEDQGRPPRPIACRPAPPKGLVVLCSRSHHDAERFRDFIGGRPVAAVLPRGSALKFGLIAAGEADLYVRFGRTMEWDTAAGHALISAAGGDVTTLDGNPLLYAKSKLANPGIVAHGAFAI